jgi:hypothetical protein
VRIARYLRRPARLGIAVDFAARGCDVEGGNAAGIEPFWQPFFMLRMAGFLLALVVGGALAAVGQTPPAETAAGLDLAAIAHWPLERLELKGGRVFRGLVRARELYDTAENVPFISVQRPAGRPMNTSVWSFPKESIAKVDFLPDNERVQLIARLEWFRNRGAYQSQELAQLVLKPGKPAGPHWIYADGPWFRLESWTDREMTRLSILRIEQMFAAYSEILPPRTKPQQPLRILLYGSMREYAEFQTQLKHRVENPALYAAKQNLLAAGSELTAYSGRLAEVRRRHAAIKAQYDKLAAGMPAAIRKLSDDLERSGVSAEGRRNLRVEALRKWKEELAEVDRSMQAIERNNNSQFDLVTKEMLARLNHEAFHAYLENFVYPHDQTDVPRWLNEGLAQVFEEGQLEAGTLRLDAPSRKRLSALQAELHSESGAPKALAELLTADARRFLATHSTSAEVSQRHYLYSWGLAHYLAVRQPILDAERLDRYVALNHSAQSPIARFEQLVGEPLAQFAPRWRNEMLAMKAPAK